MEKLKKITSNHLFLPLFALALLLVFNAFATPGFFTIEFQNGQLFGRIIDILNRASILVILSMGMTFVIATGGIDISQGSVIAISGAVCCSLIGGAGDGTANMPLLPACLIAVLVCAVCGVWNGFLVSKLKIQPMVATLILLTAGRGIAMLITKGQNVTVYYKPFTYIGSTIPGSPLPTTIFIALIMVLLVVLILKKRLWRRMTRRPNRNLRRKMLRYSIPLIPTTVFWWITSASDRYMINAMLGGDANGIYTVANKLPTILTLLSSVLMQAWQFSAIQESKSDLREQAHFYSNVWLALMAALFIASSAMIAFAKLEIRLLASDAYFDAWQYVPVLCAAMLFCAFTSFLGSVYTVTQRSGLSFWTSLIGAAVNIALNALLIPSKLGIQGAAIATFASYFIVFLVRARSARRLIPFRLFQGTLLLSTVVLAGQILFISFQWPGWQIAQAVALLGLLIIDRRQLLELLYDLARKRKKQ